MAKKEKSEMSSLNKAIGAFTKTMGDGIIHTAEELPPCTRIRSSIPAYNYVTCGGFPVGRVTEHYGPQSSLKSYVAYDAIAQFQHYDWANREQGAFTGFKYSKTGSVGELEDYVLRKGYKPKREPIVRRVILIDIEGTYTSEWGERFGIDNAGLILMRPDSLAESVDVIQTLLSEEDISLVVIDSLSAIGTDEEIDKSMEDFQMASAAKFWNKAFRKFQSAMNSNPHGEATMIVMNSAYDKVGISYGDPEVVRNGKQLGLTKSISVRFKGLKEISGKTDEGDITIGRNIVIKCMKNKVGVPFRQANFFYAYADYGFTKAHRTDVEGQIVDLALRFGLVERRGAYYQYGEYKVQGMDNFVEGLINEGLINGIAEEINTLACEV